MTCIHDIIRQADLQPSHPAIVERLPSGTRRVTTYAELVKRIADRADAFARLGLRPGQRCGLLAHQGLEFIESALGIMAAGGCVAPLPTDTPEDGLRQVREKCQLHHLWHADTESMESFESEAVIDGDGDRQFRALEPAYIRFTSGTTSERKGVLIGHASIVARTDAANAALQIGPADRVLWVLPMVHHFVVSIVLYLRKGATIVLPESSLPQAMLDAVAQERATVMYASPYHYQLLLKAGGTGSIGSVRLAVSTTTGLTSDIAAQFLERWDQPLCQALGIIEVGLPVINVANARTVPTAVGRPLPAYDVWLRGEAGERVVSDGTPDKVGEICIRGPGLFDAYLNPWTPRPQVIGSDGFRTGDMGWFDADGNLRMMGRHKNRISVAGMKFFAEEVETVLVRHPAVELCRVFPTVHVRLGDVPGAEIVVKPGYQVSLKDIVQFCRGQLESYKIPRDIQIVNQIAFTATGKVKR
jgi:long-chain acyl-CoA synthetase